MMGSRGIVFLVWLCLGFFITAISPSAGISSHPGNRKPTTTVTPMHKVQLTQRGYIQFLRWELPVPRIREFTFCVWVKSNNLTYPHSIFSYSKDERDRLVRAWISSHGRSVHLEIDGVPIAATASDIREHRWYHICQSWENRHGRYAVWINGRVKVQGHSLETVDHVIPSGGDIVLGQEYTDFDKGLEEGIEGSVLGFNLLLASSFGPLPSNYEDLPEDVIQSPSITNYASIPFDARLPTKIMRPNLPPAGAAFVSFPASRDKRALPSSLSPDRSRRSSFDQLGRPKLSNASRGERDLFTIGNWGVGEEPLGLQLVKLSYVRCEIGRGSPFIGGHLMLISWSRTPVRVFGGAVVKNAKSSCGNF